jgi:hypothetical protein
MRVDGRSRFGLGPVLPGLGLEVPGEAKPGAKFASEGWAAAKACVGQEASEETCGQHAVKRGLTYGCQAGAASAGIPPGTSAFLCDEIAAVVSKAVWPVVKETTKVISSIIAAPLMAFLPQACGVMCYQCLVDGSAQVLTDQYNAYIKSLDTVRSQSGVDVQFDARVSIASKLSADARWMGDSFVFGPYDNQWLASRPAITGDYAWIIMLTHGSPMPACPSADLQQAVVLGGSTALRNVWAPALAAAFEASLGDLLGAIAAARVARNREQARQAAAAQAALQAKAKATLEAAARAKTAEQARIASAAGAMAKAVVSSRQTLAQQARIASAVGAMAKAMVESRESLERDERRRRWFLVGGSVLVLGTVAGLVLHDRTQRAAEIGQ